MHKRPLVVIRLKLHGADWPVISMIVTSNRKISGSNPSQDTDKVEDV
jgi:hypothetical protein